jgi:hypothetical protein
MKYVQATFTSFKPKQTVNSAFNTLRRSSQLQQDALPRNCMIDWNGSFFSSIGRASAALKRKGQINQPKQA